MKVTYNGTTTIDIPNVAKDVAPGDVLDLDSDVAEALIQSGPWRRKTRGKTTTDQADTASNQAQEV